MTETDQIYAEYVEARSFACKKCGYSSTNRRVIEQHLRQQHADLFETLPAAGTPEPAAHPSPGAAGSQGHTASAPLERTPPSRVGSAAGSDPQRGSPQPSRGVGGLGPLFYTDAGTWDNGTRRQRSVLAVWDSRAQGIVIHEDLPGTTNNEAEYAAIIAALELARADGLSGIELRSDSQLCVKQIRGEYQVKEARLRPLRDRAARLLREVDGRIDWVPRGQNHAGIFLEKRYKR